MITLYVLFGVLLLIGIALGIYAYSIYQEDKPLGIKDFKKRKKEQDSATRLQ